MIIMECNENYVNNGNSGNRCGECCPEKQKHVHEVVGSVMIAREDGECHNHRFATVSEEAIRSGGSHVHVVRFRTDFYEDHYHEFCGKSSPAIEVGDGRHVHFAKSYTTCSDGHRHEFRVASLIEDPIGE